MHPDDQMDLCARCALASSRPWFPIVACSCSIVVLVYTYLQRLVSEATISFSSVNTRFHGIGQECHKSDECNEPCAVLLGHKLGRWK